MNISFLLRKHIFIGNWFFLILWLLSVEMWLHVKQYSILSFMITNGMCANYNINENTNLPIKVSNDDICL